MTIPIYRTDGEWVAVFQQGHLFNTDGEWLGFVVGREVFAPNGHYLAFLSDDQRMLRKRSLIGDPRTLPIPSRPQRPDIPSGAPLPPMFRALPYSIIDMFEEFPDRFSYISETRPDMD
ncbi:MAG: hypothetical protein IPL78_10740 [Chloroflexi bacterium]|nr:hypothetical protein [Chloroflexota bacterium]